MSSAHSLELSTDYDELERVEELVGKLASASGIDDEKQNVLMLAASEAVTNAMRHGNKMDATKKVHVNAEVTSEYIQLMVEDEGDGFNPDDIPDPLDPENLLKPSGRGVFLMKTYCDEVEHDKGGRRIRLRLNL